MDLRRIPVEEAKLQGIELKGEEFYGGTISEDEAHLLARDPRAFLDKAKIKVPPNATIRVMSNATRRPGSRVVKEHRVIVVVLGGTVIIIYDDGTVVVVSHCW